jgi:hypothetical protein
MIYRCPDCGIFWYIISECNQRITWKVLGELLITNPLHTLKRACPNHDAKYITSAGVKT